MKCVLEWLEKSAALYPDKKAVIDPQNTLTFLALHHDAQVYGSFFARHTPVRKPIAFYLEKSVQTWAAMLGGVYAGCFYSILDTRQPDIRLQNMLEILSPSFLVTDRVHQKTALRIAEKNHLKLFVLEDILDGGIVDQSLLEQIRRQMCDIDLLYVNFTSGSTGIPKGVAVRHRSVLDFIPVFVKTFAITSGECLGNQAPFDFDVSVKDLYTGLFCGASVVLIPRAYFSWPMKLLDYLCAQSCTTLIWAVSAMCFVSTMNGFQYKIPETVKKVLFSGEVMPMKQLHIWQTYLPHAMYVNLYGPTEITCNCTYYILRGKEQEQDKLPIGKAFDNEIVFLLDENNRVVKQPYTEGEICVGGTCLAAGYYGNLEKTEAAFVQNPLNTHTNERIYRTGDLAYYRADGNLVYTSRKDFQIKHLGHRIEPGEIENAAQALAGVMRACMLYHPAHKRIILFYTGPLEHAELCRELKERLPGYMIPNTIIHKENFALNKNGKIDRDILKKEAGIDDAI